MEGDEINTIIDVGLASDNEKKIIYFLEKLYQIPFDQSAKWEKELFSFFREINIVPYVIETSLNEQTGTIEDIKNSFFRSIITPQVVFISTNEIYSECIKIYEGVKNGKKLKDYLEYLFYVNHHIKQMFIKKTDLEDNRYKHFGVSIVPICCELKKGGIKVGFETTYFIVPDKDVEYPFKEWHKKISAKWKIKLLNKLNEKKMKKNKRDPIETRLRHEVFKRDGYKCLECGKTNKETTLHCDHIIPIAQGGTDELDNLQTLCQACNLAKSNRKWVGGTEDQNGTK